MIENKTVRTAAKVTAGAALFVGAAALVRTEGNIPHRLARAGASAATTAAFPAVVAAGAVLGAVSSDFVARGAAGYSMGAARCEPIGLALGSALGLAGEHLGAFVTTLGGGVASAAITAGTSLVNGALQGATSAAYEAGRAIVSAVGGR